MTGRAWCVNCKQALSWRPALSLWASEEWGVDCPEYPAGLEPRVGPHLAVIKVPFRAMLRAALGDLAHTARWLAGLREGGLSHERHDR